MALDNASLVSGKIPERHASLTSTTRFHKELDVSDHQDPTNIRCWYCCLVDCWLGVTCAALQMLV